MEDQILGVVAENPDAVQDLLWTSAKVGGHIVVDWPDVTFDIAPDVNLFFTPRGGPSGTVSATESHAASFNASSTASIIN